MTKPKETIIGILIRVNSKEQADNFINFYENYEGITQLFKVDKPMEEIKNEDAWTN